MKISKTKKCVSFSCPKIIQTKKQVLRSKDVLCSQRTDRHTHIQTHTRESEYRGHPFRVSGMFPSTYHQGLVQHDHLVNVMNYRT